MAFAIRSPEVRWGNFLFTVGDFKGHLKDTGQICAEPERNRDVICGGTLFLPDMFTGKNAAIAVSK